MYLGGKNGILFNLRILVLLTLDITDYNKTLYPYNESILVPFTRMQKL